MSKDNEKSIKKRKKKKHPRLRLAIKVSVLLLLLSILVVGIFLYFKYGKDIFEMQSEAKALVQASTTETFRSSETSIAYNKKGTKQIAVLKGDKDAYYLSIDKIPVAAKQAMIVTEDKKFYSHNGIDGQGIARAIFELVKNHGEKKQGASTITQQLSRGVFLNNAKTYERKIQEIFIATELEKKYTKDQILEFYLNTIYFANGYYGIEAASKGYFNKSCADLSLGQIIFLCAIPNNPTLYNPETNYKNTVARKNRILDQMLNDKVINQVEYDEAYNEKIKLVEHQVIKRDYVQTFITYCATKAIMKYNGFEFKYKFNSGAEKEEYDEAYSEEYANSQKMLLNNGYRIYTSIDLKKQKQLQKSLNDQLKAFKKKDKNGTYKMQGSATCIDNKSGRVVAIVGGRSQSSEGFTLNRAYQSFRQPGSCMKPLVVYTPSLERGKTAYSTINDHKFNGGPSNSSGHYYGYVSLKFAVEQSLNTVAWQLLNEITPEVGLEYLLDMNFSKICDDDYHLSASLGGLTYGVSTLEMASAYATIENDGKFRDPTCIVKILDADGNVVINNEAKAKHVYSKEAANAMTEIMKGVLTRGTARGLSLDNGMISAGKTGTTNDKKDGWFCGFTPYYTTTVWVGYDTPKTVDDLYGSTYPGRIWNSFMNKIHKGLEAKDFSYANSANTSYRSGNTSSSYSSSSNNNSAEGGSTSSNEKNTKKETDEDDEEDDENIDDDPDDNENVDQDPADNNNVDVTKKPSPTKAPATEAPKAPNAQKEEETTTEETSQEETTEEE